MTRSSSQKLLTVIVPVYKVEPYINKCLDSLILSDMVLMESLEVLIINDGTPDNSAEMSREYVKRFPNTFRQIDKENGGHGSAWNVGLKEATGRYLRFLDSDDWLSNLDHLMSDLEHFEADIVFNPYEKCFAYENRTERVETPLQSGQVSPIRKEMWATSRWGYESVNFWSSTYKSSILKPLYPLFAEKVMFDDYILTWAPLVYGRTCVAFDYVVYNYLLGRPGQSMSSTKQRRGALSYAKCFEQYEDVRSRIDDLEIPSDNLKSIETAITVYSGSVFSHLVFLPYKDAKEKMEYLWKTYLQGSSSRSKFLKRYASLPFPVFYLLQMIRNKINNR